LVKFCKLLVAKIREDRAHALDGVDAVTAARGDDNAIPAAESPWDTPVWIVKSSKSNVAANRAIAGFVERLNRCWSERSDRPETAAVLTSSWARARSAVDQLQRHGLKAQLSGLSQLLETREARDVTQLLRALLDPSDDIAWMGLLKHPSIGVSDRMLMELKPFGRSMLGPDEEDHFPAVPDPDGVRLRNVRGILRTASNQLGHGRTSEVLEEVLRALCWREIIEAGPEQREGVADLDLILDVIADAESEGVDPHAVLEVLEGTSDSRDLPNRRFATGARVVEVTTLHQSKGLEFDHVCLPWFDFSSKGSDRQSVPVDVLRLGAQTVVSVKLDPQGGITPSRDPASALFAALESTENKFESDRKVYVAATRAKETVVIGYQPPKDEDTRNAAKSLHELLGDEAQPGAQAGELSNVASLFDGDAAQMVEGGPALSPPAIRGNPRPYSRGAACQPVDLPALASTSLLSPSHYAGPHARARAVQANFLKHRQRSPGGAPAPLPGLGGGFDQRTRGDVVHGWFEHWRFAGIATTESAQSYLDANWPRLAEQPGLAEALAALGTSVLAIPGAGALLCEHGASLDFETGLVASLDEDLLVGRADLIIRHPDGWVSVVDFKGGWGEANAGEGPLQNELDYALQLGTYVAMLEAAGKRVRSIALLYAGSGDLLTCAL
jgi:ATP-dependent exoDNAse (exonuclease V) beta subunit